jgi:asparagine synthase (glutamine-hydrolysing)
MRPTPTAVPTALANPAPAVPVPAIPARARLIRAAPGPPLAEATTRRRSVSRIGGLFGLPDVGAQAALARSLGSDALILGSASAPDLVADWDACRIGSEPIRDLASWRAALWSGGSSGIDVDWSEIDGAFTLAASEAPDRLVLARDAIGERGLYYAIVPGGLVFASTLHAVLATGLVPRVLNHRALAAYLTYAYVPGRETLVQGVSKLLGGEVASFQNGRLTHASHWSVPAEADPSSAEEGCLRAALRACLTDAVRRRLPPADERVGAFLSGGLDSSLVVALARRLHQGPVSTYSVSFGDGYPNELPFSSLVAEHCGTDHHVVELSPAVVLRHLDHAIGLLSEPIGDPLTVPNALLFREAAAEVGVVLNGEGGDPCFGGPKNLPMLLAELLGDGQNADVSDDHTRERSYLRAHQKCYDDLPALLDDDVLAALSDSPLERQLRPHLEDPRFRLFVTRLMALNVTFKGAHHILPKVDAVSAPFGVVARSPLFDRAVVELAFAIPPQLKLRGSVEKYLLKEAVKDLLPPAIIERPKSGMLVPVEGWFQGPLRAEAQARILDGLAPHRLFKRDYLERLLAGRLRGLRPRRGVKTWLLLTLEAWLRTVLHG